MAISSIDFQTITSYIAQESGIHLEKSKEYLVENRLQPILQTAKVTSWRDLVSKAKIDKRVKQELIDAISTNETYFFRDSKPFDVLQNHLIPEIMEKQNSLNIWSAASSTGQEAYSIAITLKNILFNFTNYRIKITGTDISDEAVARANNGVYTKFEVGRGLTDRQVNQFFTPHGKSGEFKINDEIRYIVQFRRANLLVSSFFTDSYDIVFCRNVAIYFSGSDKRKLFMQIHRSLKRNGALIVGSTESMIDMNDLFKRENFHGTVYYRKIG